jgi:hypothetical protein
VMSPWLSIMGWLLLVITRVWWLQCAHAGGYLGMDGPHLQSKVSLDKGSSTKMLMVADSIVMTS